MHYDAANEINIDTVPNDILNAPISQDEIKNAIRHLKCGKACGVDGIPSECLRCAADSLDLPLTALFNYVFDTGEYPDEWAEGLINPIHKKGPIKQPDNYRKITVLNSLGKLFDTVLNARLKYMRQSCDEEDPFQNGFKDGHCTIDNVFILNGIIEKQKALKRPLYICYVDFKSAFDYVNRHALLYKLLNRGVEGKMLCILKSMFSKSKSRVKWNKYFSETFENLYGVLQGGVISPTLFNVFQEDLPDYLDLSCGVSMNNMIISYLLHADDLVFISETPEGLQKHIDGLHELCKQWHMIVNLMKTNVCVFNRKASKCTRNPIYFYNGHQVEYCSQYKYLGIFFSHTKTMFKSARDYLAGQANKAIFAANKYAMESVGKLLPKLQLKVFDTQILPILEYGSEIWSTCQEITVLERIQLKYLKNILCVKPQTSTLAVYGETGRFPLVVRQRVNLLKYWCRIMNMDNNRIVKNTYLELYKLSGDGHYTWCSLVKSMLSDHKRDHIWNAQSVVNIREFTNNVKEYEHSRFIEKWKQDIKDSVAHPILRTYKLYKKEFQFEPYLLEMHSNDLRKAIARFRLSSHSLRIETDRYLKPKPDVQKRICIYCDKGEVDDEIHLITSCPFHEQYRTILLDYVKFIYEPSMLSKTELFSVIMSSKCHNVILQLGRFLRFCFHDRNTVTQTDRA